MITIDNLFTFVIMLCAIITLILYLVDKSKK